MLFLRVVFVQWVSVKWISVRFTVKVDYSAPVIRHKIPRRGAMWLRETNHVIIRRVPMEENLAGPVAERLDDGVVIE